MRIDDVHRGITKNKKTKRLGRGPGSGQGKTGGRGHKGQRSRAGWSQRPGFQGGSMPLVRRVPKRGFHNPFALQVTVVNVGMLDKEFASGDAVNLDSLRKKSLIKGSVEQLKILGNGSLTKKLRVSAHRFSKAAEEQIRKAGGEVIILPQKTPVHAPASEA